MSFELTFLNSKGEEIFEDELLTEKLREVLNISSHVNCDEMLDAPFNGGQTVGEYYKYYKDTTDLDYHCRCRHVSFVDGDICYAFGTAGIWYTENEIRIYFCDPDLLKIQMRDGVDTYGQEDCEQINIETEINEWIRLKTRCYKTKSARGGHPS